MSKRFKILVNYFLGPVLFVALSWSLYKQIINQPDLPNRWNEIKNSWLQPAFGIIVALMFANWGIEAKKWQVLMGSVQKISFVTAFKSVLAGCSITMLTPNRVGEYGGRILYIDEGNRIKAISLTIVGSISQLLITLGVGCTGLILFRFTALYNTSIVREMPSYWSNGLIFLSVIVTVVLFMFYLRIGWLVRIMEKVPSLSRIVRPVAVLDDLRSKQLWSLLLLSLLRYLIFVIQYVLIFRVMNIGVPGWLCFWLMTVFFLIMAIAPTFGFIELPVRMKASWEIFKLYTANEIGVSAASLGIWLINLVIPAVIGSLLILSIKIVKEND